MALPKRSEHPANHPLANVASSKRAEVILMRRFDVVQEAAPITIDAKQAYTQLYTAELADSQRLEAVRELLPALRSTSPILGMES
jgi:hypothetical protein